MSDTYLVTGGAGFIGSNLIREIARSAPSASIRNLDALTYAGVQQTVEELDDIGDHEFVQGSVTDPSVVDRVMDGVDVVFHCAAESHVDRSIEEPAVFTETNVVGTGILLDAAMRHGVQGFVHVSTDEVYGSVAEGAPDEQARLDPSSPYAASKAGADLLALSYWKTFDFPVIVTRCTNNYGPYQFPEKLIPLTIVQFAEGGQVPIYGDGLQERDWLYVTDHCAALMLVAAKGRPGEIYNIGADAQLANIDLVRKLAVILDADVAQIEYVADRLGHDRRYALDSTKVRALGWSPAETIETQLARTAEWYQQRTDWWQPLRNRTR